MKKYSFLILLSLICGLSFAQTKPAAPAAQKPAANSKDIPTLNAWGNKAINQAESNFQAGKTQAAFDTVDLLIEKFPNSYAPIATKGSFFARLSLDDNLSKDSAQLFTQRATDILDIVAAQNEDKNLKNAALMQLIDVYTKNKKDNSKILQYISALIDSDPKNPYNYIRRSNFYLELGRIGEACDDTHKALDLGLKDPGIEARLEGLGCSPRAK